MDVSAEIRRQQCELRNGPGLIEVGPGTFTDPVALEQGQNLYMRAGRYDCTLHNAEAATLPDPVTGRGGFGYGMILPKGNNLIFGDGTATVIVQPPRGCVVQPYWSGLVTQAPHFNLQVRDFKVIGNGHPNQQGGVIMLGNVCHGVIDNIHLSGTSSMGFVMGGSAQVGCYGMNQTIRNCTVYSGFPTDDLGASVQIGIVNVKGGTVENCKLYRLGAAGAAIDVEPNGSESRAESIRIVNNTIDFARRHNEVGDVEQIEGYWNRVPTPAITFADGIKIQQGQGDSRNISVLGNTLIGGFDMNHFSLKGIHVNGRKNREVIIADNILSNWHFQAMDINGHHMLVHHNVMRDMSSNDSIALFSCRASIIDNNEIHQYRYGADAGHMEENTDGVDGWTDHNVFTNNRVWRATNGLGGWNPCSVVIVGPNSFNGGKANPNRMEPNPDTWDYGRALMSDPPFYQP